MTESNPETPTPSAIAGIERFHDFDALANFYVGWNVSVEQYSAGPFSGTIRLARTRTMYAVDGQFSQALTVRGASNPAETAFYLIEPENADSVWWGRRFAPGQLVALGPDVAAEYHSSQYCRTAGVAVPTDLLVRAMHAVVGSYPLEKMSDWTVLKPTPIAGAALGLQLRRLLAAGVADPAMLATSEWHRLEQECLLAMVAAAQPLKDQARTDLPLSSRSLLVKRAEELMRSHLKAAFGTIDLCTTLGVSDRTLRQAFRERYGIGPMIYYKMLRLNAVRASLKTEGPETVADIARLWGFHHLGNFAADYRRAFGERPSQTRKQSTK